MLFKTDRIKKEYEQLALYNNKLRDILDVTNAAFAEAHNREIMLTCILRTKE